MFVSFREGIYLVYFESFFLFTPRVGEDYISCLMTVIQLMEKIRRSPVEVDSLSDDSQGFIHPRPRWCRISSINSI